MDRLRGRTTEGAQPRAREPRREERARTAQDPDRLERAEGDDPARRAVIGNLAQPAPAFRASDPAVGRERMISQLSEGRGSLADRATSRAGATQRPAPVTAQDLERRRFRGFREVDPAALRAALPPQARHLASTFIDAGRRHNLDPLVLAAISRHETANFTSSAFRNKNNAMGISDARGPRRMASHEASINHMAQRLASPTSPYRNAQNLRQLWHVYAPPSSQNGGRPVSNDPGDLNRHWGGAVERFTREYERATGARPLGPASAPAPAAAPEQPRSPGQSPGNGTATFDRVDGAGRRNQMVTGRITVNGNTYQFRSGGHGRGSLPAGEYTVTPHRWSRGDRSMNVGGVGYSFAVSDKYDPRVRGTRSLLRIHPDGGTPGTEGCIGIVGDAATQRRFREDMRAELARNGGRFRLRVG